MKACTARSGSSFMKSEDDIKELVILAEDKKLLFFKDGRVQEKWLQL